MTDKLAREDYFLKSLPTQRLMWSANSLAGYMRCPQLYYLSTVEGWKGQGTSVDIEFGKYMGEAVDVFNKALAKGASTEEALEFAVEHALQITYLGDGQFWGGVYRRVWKCDGKVKGAKGRPVKCPHSKQWNLEGEGGAPGYPMLCRHCGAQIEPQVVYFPADKTKNRHTLIRAVVAYADFLATSNIRPYILDDGRIGSELKFAIELPLETPDGNHYIISGDFDQLATIGESELCIPEMKTTRKDPNEAYFGQFEPGAQLYIYTWAGDKMFPGRKPKVYKIVIHLGVGFADVKLRRLRLPDGVVREWEEEMMYWISKAESDAYEAQALVIAGEDPSLAYHRNPTACHSTPGAPNSPCPFRGICRLDPANRKSFLKSNFTKSEHTPLDPKGSQK